VSAVDARRLIEQASQAPYGRGEETIVDTNVRRVEADPNCGPSSFRPVESKIFYRRLALLGAPGWTRAFAGALRDSRVTDPVRGSSLNQVTAVPAWLVAFVGATVLLFVHKTVGRGELIPIIRGDSL
jgi:hypothetical protein